MLINLIKPEIKFCSFDYLQNKLICIYILKFNFLFVTVHLDLCFFFLIELIFIKFVDFQLFFLLFIAV
jgi:hypothetical protein